MVARRYLTVAEYARATGTPPRTVRHHCATGALRCRKPKGRWRILASELDQDVKGRESR